MFNSPILDVIIGLFFVYLLLSLLATAINELAMTYLNARGKGLAMGLQKMLDDSSAKVRLSHYIFDSPLFKKLYRPGSKRLPSYLSGGRFMEIFLFAIHERRVIAQLVSGVKSSLSELRDEKEVFDSLPEIIRENLYDIDACLDELTQIGSEKIEDSKTYGALFNAWRKDWWKTLKRQYTRASITAERNAQIEKITQLYRAIKQRRPEKLSKEERKAWQYIDRILEKLKEGKSEFADVKVTALKFEDIRMAIESLPDGDTRVLLRSVLRDANESLVSFKHGLEKWYDEVMDKASAWYKRKVQIVLLIIGFGVSIAFNADTFSIARKLGDDPEARMHLVEMAAGYTQSREEASIGAGGQGGDDADKIEAIRRQIDGLIDNEISGVSDLLGLGWSDWDRAYRNYRITQPVINALRQMGVTQAALDSLQPMLQPEGAAGGYRYDEFRNNLETHLSPTLRVEYEPRILQAARIENASTILRVLERFWNRLRYGFSRFPGWLVTSIAISLGAPFWFDLLKKIIHLRGTGKRPSAESSSGSNTPVG